MASQLFVDGVVVAVVVVAVVVVAVVGGGRRATTLRSATFQREMREPNEKGGTD